MKLIRILLVGVAGIVVLLAVVIALAFNSGVQTWAARKAVATQPGLNLQIGRVNAGLNTTRVEKLRFAQPGLDLILPAAEVRVSLVDAAKSRVAVKSVVAKGWTLDLSQPATTATRSVAAVQPPAGSAREAFEGIFKQLRLPVDFSLDGLDIEGDVILPDGQGTVHVTMTGGNIGAGKDGKIVFKAGLASAKKDAPVGTLTLQSDITVRMDTPRSFEHVAVTTDATATGEQFPKGAAVHVAMDAARGTEGDEAYSVVLRTGDKELVNCQVKLPPGTAPLAGTWVLDVHDGDLAPFTLGRRLPAFTAAGQGTFSADRAFSEVHATGQLNTTVDKLETLSREFSAIGRVDFTADFDVIRQGDFIRIERFNAQISGARPVVSIEARQVLKFNSATHELEAAFPGDDLFKINVQGLPLAWARPFLPGIDMTGDDLRGKFAAGARDGGFALRALEPLTLTGLNVSQGGKPLVSGLDVTLSAGGDYTPKGWQAEVSNLSVVNGATPLLKLTARAGQTSGANQPIKATGTFEADLPSLLSQPAAPAGVALSEGVARGDFTASLTDKQEIGVTLQLAGLVTKDHARMPAIALYVRADRNADGRIEAQAPLVITQAGRKSDLTLGAIVQPLKTGMQIDAQMKSEALYIEDLQLFSGLVSPASPSAAPAPSPAPAPVATGPVWAGVSGELKMELKKVVYSSAIQVTDIAGTVKITPDTLSLDALRAALGGEATLKAAGSLNYNAKKAAKPYALKADLAVANFDPAPVLIGLDPSKPAQVEGKFDLTTHLSGRAADPAGFKDTALGDVSLTSRGGTLRVLSVKSGNTVAMASKAAAVIGLLGALTGNSQASRLGPQSEAAAAVAQQLGTIKFDQLNIVLSRDAAHDVLIKDITLISPQMRMAGSGKISFVPDVPFRRQPLLINLQIGARDQLADNFRQLHLLRAGGADELGYVPLTQPIQLDGTLQSIGTAQLQKLIYNAITN